jgi:hypothetical protein
MLLSAAREELSQVLNDAGVRAFAALPDRVSPPFAVIWADQDWITPSEVYCPGDYLVNFTIQLTATAGSLGKVHTELDDQVSKALLAVEGSDWFLVTVDRPSINGTELNASIHVSRNININEGGN